MMGWSRWSPGPLLALAATLVGCAGPIHGLDERLRRLRGSLEEVSGSAHQELARSRKIAPSTWMLLETAPFQDIHAIPEMIGDLGRLEMRRPHQAFEDVASLRGELARPARIMASGRLLPSYLGQEGARTPAALDGAGLLLSLELGRRMIRDPRRADALPGQEESGLLPRPLSFTQALFRSLPIW